MWTEWIGSVVCASLGILLFGRFEERTLPARRVARWAVYFAGVAVLTWRVGRPWSLLWTFGALGPGTLFHVWWCWKHGIHPLTAQPRARYLALRGWAPDATPAEASDRREDTVEHDLA